MDNNTTFNRSILNLITILLVILSLFFYYQVQFYVFLILASIIVLINFNNYWYIYWISLVFLGPILSSIFLNNTFGNMCKNLINNVVFLLVGMVIYYFLVSIVGSLIHYITRKKIINMYRTDLNEKIAYILEKSDVSSVDFSLKLSPLSYKSQVNDRTKVEFLKDFGSKLDFQLNTHKFKNALFGDSNTSFLESLKKYLEIKDLLNNYRIENSNSVMSIFNEISSIFKKNNISLNEIEDVYKAMDYETMVKLERDFINNYNSVVLTPPKERYIKGLINHTSFKYIDTIDLELRNDTIELHDIVIHKTGVFLIQEYYDHGNIHNLKIDINGVFVKFYNSGEIDIDKNFYTELTSKAKTLEGLINSKLSINSSYKPITVNPIIILDTKDSYIENQSPTKIIQSHKLEETISNFDNTLSNDVKDSILTIISSLIPELPTYEYEFPSENILNLVHLGLLTIKLTDELHKILIEETEEFISKYKP